MRDGPGTRHDVEDVSPPVSEALASSVAAVRAALGSEPLTVRVLLVDRGGRLRLAAAHGRGDRGGRLRSTRRRAVMQAGRSATSRSGDGHLLMLPLAAHGRSIGLIELVTAADPAGRVKVLEAVASQAAAMIVAAEERAGFELELRASEATVALARELLRTRTVTAAVRATTDHLHEHLGAPTIGLLRNGSADGWEVVRIRGFGARRRAELRAALSAGGGGGPGHPPAGELRRLQQVVGTVARVDRVDARRAGPALLITPGAPPGAQRFLAGAATLLAEASERIDEVDPARLHSRGLDLGIAWAAHELRAPLVGARQAIDHVLDRNGSPAAQESMLRRTRQDLSDLADLVDPLLRWSSGGRAPSRHRMDLAVLVREAAALSCRGEREGRIRVRGEGDVTVRAHAAGLRTAIANLLRNAVAYSPPGTTVDVWVGLRGGKATVVISDRGPGVREHDRERIFAPYARAEAARGRNGRGLGLSIAKRIVEAHGGAIGVDSDGRGSEFWLEVPAMQEGRHRSVS